MSLRGSGVRTSIGAERAMKHTVPDALRRRTQILEARRTLKVASSAHAHVRGSTLAFYEWLNDRPGKAVPAGPPVWICGDCHAGNLGLLAAAADRSLQGTAVHSLRE